MEQAFTALKNELMENKAIAQTMYQRIRLEKQSMRYLQRFWNKLDSVPKDSLYIYGNAALQSTHITFKYDALESMKMSGLFHKLTQKGLTLNISKANSSIHALVLLFKEYVKEKHKHLDELKKHKELRDLPDFLVSKVGKPFSNIQKRCTT